jgi:prepilin-type N-terminal cleavage/methylation domain-containing protein
MRFFSKLNKGFTLPEVLLSLTLLAIIGGMTIPMYRIFIVRNDLDSAATTLAQNLRRAQTLAWAGDGDMSWGVHLGVGSILLYKGTSFATRDTNFDENTSIPTTIAVSGINDILFTRITGIPNATGTFTLTSQTSEIRNVTINEKGMVDY